MECSSPSHPILPEELAEFVATELGPASLDCFQQPKVLAQYQQLRADGAEVVDAALCVAHREAIANPAIGDEFLGHFLSSMMRVGSLQMRGGMRRYLDSGDLVNSVMGSLWKDLASTSFTTRSEYLAFLGRRLQWKAADKAKGLAAGKRRQDLQLEIDFEAFGIANAEQAGPATLAGNQEDHERLLALLPRLPPRDSEILRRAWRGEDVTHIADAMGLAKDAARKALTRAIEKAQRLI